MDAFTRSNRVALTHNTRRLPHWDTDRCSSGASTVSFTCSSVMLETLSIRRLVTAVLGGIVAAPRMPMHPETSTLFKLGNPPDLPLSNASSPSFVTPGEHPARDRPARSPPRRCRDSAAIPLSLTR